MAKMWDQSGKKIPRYDPGVNINDKHILDTLAIDSLFSFFITDILYLPTLCPVKINWFAFFYAGYATIFSK